MHIRGDHRVTGAHGAELLERFARVGGDGRQLQAVVIDDFNVLAKVPWGPAGAADLPGTRRDMAAAEAAASACGSKQAVGGADTGRTGTLVQAQTRSGPV